MSTFVKMMTDAGDQYLSTLSEVQENFVKATSAMSARVAAATPTPPAPVVENPFASMLPTPKEMMEASFEFSQKLLKQQKSFAEKLLAASTPAK
jgi:hypothetical protein